MVAVPACTVTQHVVVWFSVLLCCFCVLVYIVKFKFRVCVCVRAGSVRSCSRRTSSSSLCAPNSASSSSRRRSSVTPPPPCALTRPAVATPSRTSPTNRIVSPTCRTSGALWARSRRRRRQEQVEEEGSARVSASLPVSDCSFCFAQKSKPVLCFLFPDCLSHSSGSSRRLAAAPGGQSWSYSPSMHCNSQLSRPACSLKGRRHLGSRSSSSSAPC